MNTTHDRDPVDVNWLRDERDRQVAIRDQRFETNEARIDALERTVEAQAEQIADLLHALRSVRGVLGGLS